MTTNNTQVDETKEERCNDVHVLESTLFYTDVVYCSKPAGHKKPEHIFTTHPRQGKPITYRWTR